MSADVILHGNESRESLADEILQIVRSQLSLGSEVVQLDTDLESLGITSVDVVSIVWAIEKQYGIEIPLEQLSESAVRGLPNVAALSKAVAGVLEKRPGTLGAVSSPEATE